MLGVDVSNNNGTIDWSKVAADKQGIRFAYAKATEGTTFRDGHYAGNRAGCKTHGIAFGAYHFARPSKDAAAQAQAFVAFAKPRAGELVPMLDFENADGRSAAQLRAWCLAFLKAMDALKVRCGVYTFPGFAQNVPQAASVKGRLLWIAHVGPGGQPRVKPPTIPAPWTHATFWQYSWKGRVAGCSGDVDMNRLVTVSDPLLAYRL